MPCHFHCTRHETTPPGHKDLAGQESSAAGGPLTEASPQSADQVAAFSSAWISL
jgi:hypothetical protein